tara:strand:- start:2081 stop:2272 length:192 start_codon:yes stop_codon:yes gene_type:complete
MQANRFHFRKVIEEVDKNFFDPVLMKKAQEKSKGIDKIVLANYMILRAEVMSSQDKLSLRRFP